VRGDTNGVQEVSSCMPANTTSWVNDVLGGAGFRKALRLKGSVGRSMVYPIAPISACLTKGPTMWGKQIFCEKEKVRGVLVQHRNDIDQGRAADPRLLYIYGKEFEFYGRLVGGRGLIGCRGLTYRSIIDRT
jgi:hypothetical protein